MIWAYPAAGDILLAVCDGVVLIGPEVDPGDVADVDGGAGSEFCWENVGEAGENGVERLEGLVELGWRRGDEDGRAYDN